VPKLLLKGINVGLGTDGYINNFFEVMRGAFLIHKAAGENPEIMPAETVFTMATENGGKALRTALETGSGTLKTGVLEKGYLADIITIDPDLPTPLNENNIFDQLILYCNPPDVKEVFVGGRALKKDGQLLDFDQEAVRKEVENQAIRLWEEIT
jgi:cytosine/adenosine deaminase-related metal-dependent hydrolase